MMEVGGYLYSGEISELRSTASKLKKIVNRHSPITKNLKECVYVEALQTPYIGCIEEMKKGKYTPLRCFRLRACAHTIRLLGHGCIEDIYSALFLIAAVDARLIPILIRKLGTDLRKNSLIISKAVKRNGNALGSAAAILRNNETIVLKAVSDCGQALRYASTVLKAKHTIVTTAIRQYGDALRYAHPRLQDTFDIVKIAVQNSGSALEYASKRLRSDRTLAYIACRSHGRALKFVTAPDLKCDPNLVLVAIAAPQSCKQQETTTTKYYSDLVYSRDYSTFETEENNEAYTPKASSSISSEPSSPSSLSDIPEFFCTPTLRSERRDSQVLKYADPSIRANRDIIMAAISRHGWALRYASKDLKNDREVVLLAVANNGYALQLANIEFRNDFICVLTAVTQAGDALEFASDALKDNFHIVMRAVASYGESLRHAHARLRANREICMTAVKQNGYALEYVADKLREDEAIVLAAITSSGQRGGGGWAFRWAADTLKTNHTFLNAAVLRNTAVLYFIQDEDLRAQLTASLFVDHDRFYEDETEFDFHSFRIPNQLNRAGELLDTRQLDHSRAHDIQEDTPSSPRRIRRSRGHFPSLLS